MHLARVLAIPLTLALVVTAFSRQTSTLTPNAIFHGGKVVTVDTSFSIHQAFAIQGDRFLAIGSDADIQGLAGPQTRKIDLRGSTVIPGLMDNHNHVYQSAMASRGVDVAGVTSRSEMLSRIEAAVRSSSDGKVVFTTAGWTLPDAPTLDDLDRVSSVIPIVVPRLGRGAPILNTPARKLAGLDALQTDSPREAETDWPAILNKLLPPMSNQEEEQLILKIQSEKNAEGLTSVRDLQLDIKAMRAYHRIWLQGKFTVRTSMGLDGRDLDQLREILRVSTTGAPFGDHWLRLDSFSEGPSPIPGTAFMEAVLLINRNGWRPSPHVCDRGCGRPGEYESLDLALDAYEAADRENSIRDKRWVLEHIPTVQPSQMKRMAQLGVVVSAQFQPFKWGPAEYDRMVQTMGSKELAERQVPIRELLDHQIKVGTGSDTHGFGQVDDPFVPFYFYVTRKTTDGRLLDPRQKITRAEALRVSTINNAYLTFEETVKGSIEPGKLADFVILSDDILTVPEDRILSIRPLATYVGGRKVFAKADAPF